MAGDSFRQLAVNRNVATTVHTLQSGVLQEARLLHASF